MNNLKNIFALVALSVLIMPFAAACGAVPADTGYTVRQIADVMIASQDEISTLHPLSINDEYFHEYLFDIYGAGDIGMAVVDGIIFYTTGPYADEIAVFLLADGEDTRSLTDALEEYIKGRISAFMGYAPEQAAILESGRAVAQGRYAALIVCKEAGKAEDAFRACFSGTPPALPAQNDAERKAVPSPEPSPTPISESPASNDVTPVTDVTPEPTPPDETPPYDMAEDVYDLQAIIEAYRSGDDSKLTPKNKSILDACYDVIYELISYDMSDYEKELAIHDWIIVHAEYDMETLSNAPDASPDPDNDNPYGLLINGKAICRGYTNTFKLFMDLLGIECIVVDGSRSDGLEHAWNMVRIDGEWYCVDVTWNDPTGSGPASISDMHRFFNVSSRFMRETGHVWDESAFPEATAGKLYY